MTVSLDCLRGVELSSVRPARDLLSRRRDIVKQPRLVSLISVIRITLALTLWATSTLHAVMIQLHEMSRKVRKKQRCGQIDW